MLASPKWAIDPSNVTVHIQCNFVLDSCLLVLVQVPSLVKLSRFFNAKVRSINRHKELALILVRKNYLRRTCIGRC